MSEICESCRKLFQNWERLANLQYKGILYSSINVMDLGRNAALGCNLCKMMMMGSIPKLIKDIWNLNKPFQWLRIPMDLSGAMRNGLRIYLLRLDYGKGIAEICTIPVSGLYKVLIPIYTPSD
jgi:hypothetical protein